MENIQTLGNYGEETHLEAQHTSPFWYDPPASFQSTLMGGVPYDLVLTPHKENAQALASF